MTEPYYCEKPGWYDAAKDTPHKCMERYEHSGSCECCCGAIHFIEEHESREEFKYKGERIVSPHMKIDALVKASNLADEEDV